GIPQVDLAVIVGVGRVEATWICGATKKKVERDDGVRQIHYGVAVEVTAPKEGGVSWPARLDLGFAEVDVQPIGTIPTMGRYCESGKQLLWQRHEELVPAHLLPVRPVD